MSYGPDQILNGEGNSDYERYIRTPELLRLQKGPDEWMHRDELLFTVVHQSSELWLKLATSEVTQCIEYLKENNSKMALRLFPRVLLCIAFCHDSLDMLEMMSPWDYQQVRRALGHGSGFDSPGFNNIRKVIPGLWDEFARMLQAEGLSLLQLFLDHENHDHLYRLAEGLLEIDERMYL